MQDFILPFLSEASATNKVATSELICLSTMTCNTIWSAISNMLMSGWEQNLRFAPSRIVHFNIGMQLTSSATFSAYLMENWIERHVFLKSRRRAFAPYLNDL